MRWELTKKAWALAKRQFGQHCFVAPPDVISNNGYCSVINLSNGQEFGLVRYALSHIGAETRIKLSLNESHEEFSLPRCDNRRYVTPKAIEIHATSIESKYSDKKVIAGKLADLIRWHDDGITSVPSPSSVEAWLDANGFGTYKDDVLAEMGLKTVKLAAMKRKFDKYERVRISDPNSMEYKELGQIVNSATYKGKRYYFVLVDGSESPIWVAEQALSPNFVGRIDNDLP